MVESLILLFLTKTQIATTDGFARTEKVADTAARAILPRFNGILDARFGMTRAVGLGKHKISFAGAMRMGEKLKEMRFVYAPDSPEQRQIVREFKDQGQTVAFYTLGIGKQVRLRGPAYMLNFQSGAPDLATMANQVPKLKSSDQPLRVGEWIVHSRPVFATQKACVSCHNAQENEFRYQLGSKIGMLLIAVKA